VKGSVKGCTYRGYTRTTALKQTRSTNIIYEQLKQRDPRYKPRYKPRRRIRTPDLEQLISRPRWGKEDVS
jgi:hypothetical protein